MTPSPHDDTPPIRPPPLKQEDEPKGLMGTKPIRPTHERQKSHEDGQIRRLTDFSPLDHDSVGQTPVVDLSRQRYNGGVTSSRNKQPDHGPVVPKFGDWDESNPASAEGYTHMFEKVREEKQIGEERFLPWQLSLLILMVKASAGTQILRYAFSEQLQVCNNVKGDR
ncbi:hypothetical protein C3L33_17385, partial [Rhododendron williamsianum]